MKSALDLRPVFHRRDDRIVAHVQLCWLALRLICVVENTVDDTWRNVANELKRMHLVTLASPEGTVAQRSLTTPRRREVLAALELPNPPATSISPGERFLSSFGASIHTSLRPRARTPWSRPWSRSLCARYLRNSGQTL